MNSFIALHLVYYFIEVTRMMQILRLYSETVYTVILWFFTIGTYCVFFKTLTGCSAHEGLSPVMKKIRHPIVWYRSTVFLTIDLNWRVGSWLYTTFKPFNSPYCWTVEKVFCIYAYINCINWKSIRLPWGEVVSSCVDTEENAHPFAHLYMAKGPPMDSDR